MLVALLFLTILFLAVARLAIEVTPAVRSLPDSEDSDRMLKDSSGNIIFD